jgi:nanoRNase/pAp phosphatase (c-di-AMP/oligoRNAs hydrolase)
LKDAKKILLVTRKNPDFDTYLSLTLLAEVIKQDLGKKVELACESELPRNFQEAAPMPDIKKMTQLPPKSFILEFKNQENKVRNIQWNQNQDKISLYITMDQGNLKPENLDVNISGSDHDLIILVGVNTLEELGALYQAGKNIFEESKLVVFGRRSVIKLPQAKVIESDKTSTISEQVLNYLETNGIKLNPQRAAKVLAAIFSVTEGFKKNLADARTYENCAKLTRMGATNDAASTLAAKGKSSQQPASGDNKPKETTKPEGKTEQQPQQAREAGAQTAPKQAYPAGQFDRNSIE